MSFVAHVCQQPQMMLFCSFRYLGDLCIHLQPFLAIIIFFCRIIDSDFIHVGYAVRHNECWITLREYQGQEALCAPSKFNEEKNWPVDT